VAAPAQETASVLAAERAFVESAGRDGLVAALRSSLAPDAVLLWPGAPVAVGADAQRLLGAQPVLDSLRVTLQPLSAHVARDSSLGVTWGLAVGALRSGDAPARTGRYCAAWRREGNGWRLEALLLSALALPQAAVLPEGMPLRRTPLAATGAAGPFVAADLAFARLAGDSGAAIAFERWAAPDVMIFGAGGVLTRGPAAVGRLVGGPAAWSWHPVAAGAAGSGDLGWTVGESVIVPQGGTRNYGKYLTVWVRLADGSVRYTTDGGTPRPPTP
jgi:ketosteroid isomerase-like protein